MGKRTVPVRSYDKQDGTHVRSHKRRIDDIKSSLRGYEPLSDDWVEKMKEADELHKEEEDIAKSLGKTIKQLQAEKKSEEKKLIKNINDDIDDSEQELGKKSNLVDDLSIDVYDKKDHLGEKKKNMKQLNYVIII